MAKRIEKKINSQRVAENWLARGIIPVPLKHKSKQPSGGRGWNKVVVTEKTIPKHFLNGNNVGGLWGEPSDWIVDVDLDWDEAADVASYLLPETFTYGRRSRPGTHYLYRCKDIPTTKFQIPSDDKNKRTVVEIRSTGCQSVLPPSIHPDNERYQIDVDDEIVSITREELKRRVGYVAAAAVLIRCFPDSGGRHDYFHIATGCLMHTGWEPAEAQKFMFAIWEVLSEVDEDPAQRKRTIKQTIHSFQEGGNVQGWSSLVDFVGGQLVMFLQKCLVPVSTIKKEPIPPEMKKEKKGKKKPPAEDNEIRRLKVLSDVPKFDKKLLEVPGLVGEIIKYSIKSTHIPHPCFSLACALMSTAVICENKYMVAGGWNTPLQPYLLLLGPTSSGKNDALRSVKDIVDKVGMPEEATVEGFQSYYAMMDHLQEHGSVCWTWDEAARHLASAKNPNSPSYVTITHMTSLYGAAQRKLAGMPGRNKTIPPLDHPCLLIMAAAQPEELVKAVTTTDVATGFVNRLMLFDVGDTMLYPNDEKSTVFPSALKRQATAIRKHKPKRIYREDGTEEVKPTLIQPDHDAYTFLRDFLRRSLHRDDNEMWGRAHQNAVILAGLVAVGINPTKPKIDLKTAKWAVEVVRWSIRCWTIRLAEKMPDTLWTKEALKIEGFIRNSRNYAEKRRNTKTERELLARGLMPWSPLLRMAPCRTIQLQEHIERLLDARLIGVGEEDGLIVYFGKD